MASVDINWKWLRQHTVSADTMALCCNYYPLIWTVLYNLLFLSSPLSPTANLLLLFGKVEIQFHSREAGSILALWLIIQCWKMILSPIFGRKVIAPSLIVKRLWRWKIDMVKYSAQNVNAGYFICQRDAGLSKYLEISGWKNHERLRRTVLCYY